MKGRELEGKLCNALSLRPVNTLASVYQELILKYIVLMYAAENPWVIILSNERLSGVIEYKTPVHCGN